MYFVSVIAEKTLDDVNLTKLPSDEGTVVYNNEPGPEKYVLFPSYTVVQLCSVTTSVAWWAAKFISSYSVCLENVSLRR